ncbi:MULTISPECIES: flagellar basal body P-ring formation chaperone FlgA [unclassified Pseudoalteromonas]|uniref:flagellar basal body P-ring formation chaperone FlgA n=1 Tax=unclassified Pseudoalteromonas TaxID=194690 RepID=UPI001109CF72|nr:MULTISPECIES: flagellar basal body P-ring formation chaperone FlgA [unclassified Pseudoalteromonas]TMN85865.1 flagella basal body P-ring formation protein FlgA [Pseudoalteromonas sp. S410]TMN93194.1 flagella basal body P-ring formation protein FlgA [Pseudoalteromonas sp. S408]TMN99684.1 flagella basal body P-ring formation protein FlgA [Pseudoalteromonas sp. S407]TMO00460.1 flagella basal body P-ring formation protein FlgA [Pseudoalteromonas sp. S409]TMO12606.1 flagella basal body P-ring fo
MSLLKKIKRYSVFYFVASLGFAFPVSAQVFSKALLQEMAVNYIAEQIGERDSKQIQLSALPLDSRIPDRACSTTPTIISSSEPPFNRQITIQIKCDDLQSWAQYVHIKVQKMAPVVVTTDNIARGEVITSDHLTIEMKPTHFVRVQYLDEPKVLIGSRSKRNIREGMPILLNQICMVCKGDAINIYASIKGLRIKTTGVALEDGTLGDQIRVENKKTGKVLNARVDGVESVQVNI